MFLNLKNSFNAWLLAQCQKSMDGLEKHPKKNLTVVKTFVKSSF